MIWLLIGCFQDLTVDPLPEAEVEIGPHPLTLRAPEVCEATCCGLVGAECCGRTQIELTAEGWGATLLDTAWLADRGARLRVTVDTRTCGQPAPEGCEGSGSVDLEPDQPTTCDLLYDLYGQEPILCADAPNDPDCLREPPGQVGLLTFLFDERDPVDLFVELP